MPAATVTPIQFSGGVLVLAGETLPGATTVSLPAIKPRPGVPHHACLSVSYSEGGWLKVFSRVRRRLLAREPRPASLVASPPSQPSVKPAAAVLTDEAAADAALAPPNCSPARADAATPFGSEGLLQTQRQALTHGPASSDHSMTRKHASSPCMAYLGSRRHISPAAWSVPTRPSSWQRATRSGLRAGPAQRGNAHSACAPTTGALAIHCAAHEPYPSRRGSNPTPIVPSY